MLGVGPVLVEGRGAQLQSADVGIAEHRTVSDSSAGPARPHRDTDRGTRYAPHQERRRTMGATGIPDGLLVSDPWSAVQALVSLPWEERWAVLGQRPELGHRALAESCRDRDPLLTQALVRVAERGLHQARAEVDWVLRLRGAADLAHLVQLTRKVPKRVARASWLRAEALDLLAALNGPEASDAYLRFAARAGGIRWKDVEVVTSLVQEPRRDWVTHSKRSARRTGGSRRLAKLARAADVVAEHDERFATTRRRPVAELAAFLGAALLAGVERAGRELAAIHWADRCLRRVQTRCTERRLTAAEEAARRLQLLGADAPSEWLAGAAVRSAGALVDALPTGHVRRSECLALASSAFLTALQHAPASVTTEQAASGLEWGRELLLAARGDDRALLANNLGFGIGLAVQASIVPSETLDEAVDLHRLALSWTSATDPARFVRMANLASRISEAVSAGRLPLESLRESADLHLLSLEAPLGDPDRPMFLLNRAVALSELADVGLCPESARAEALNLIREAIAGRQPDGNDAMFWDTLGTMLGDAVRAGIEEPEVLLEAIEAHATALAATPVGHPYAAQRRGNSATRIAQAVHSGVLPPSRLLDAIDLQRIAVTLPEGHPDLPGLVANLASLLEEGLDLGLFPGLEDEAAEVATRLTRTALELTPRDHPHFAGRAANMATRLAVIGGMAELTEAVRHSEDAVAFGAASSDGQLYQANHASILLDAIEAGVLDAARSAEAIGSARSALRCTPSGHPYRVANLTTVAVSLARAVALEELPPESLGEALTLLAEACDEQAPTPDWFLAQVNHAVLLLDACEREIVSLTDAADRMTEVVQAYTRWMTEHAHSPQERRQAADLADALVSGGGLVIAHGHGPSQALAAIEAVRGSVLRARTAPPCPPSLSTDDRAKYREAAERYERTQRLLADGVGDARDARQAGMELASVLRGAGEPGFRDAARVDHGAQLGLDEAAVILVPGIAGLPGIALVVSRGADPISVELGSFTEASVVEHVNRIHLSRSLVGSTGRWLGEAVWTPLEPVLRGTATAHWALIPCGASVFLPFHASPSPLDGWIDDGSTITMLPSLSVRAIRRPRAASGVPLVAIGETSGLQLVRAEAEQVAREFGQLAGCPTPLTGRLEEALESLNSAPLAYFGGHGDIVAGVGAGLRFPGGYLTTDEILRCEASSRGVALVASCWSAAVAPQQPDEVLGLPRALLEIGFQGVVASLWPVDDRAAFLLVLKFLAGVRDGLSGPESLSRARRWLRETKRGQLLDWVSGSTDAATVSPETRDQLTSWLNDRGETPCADARYWGAFIYVGS